MKQLSTHTQLPQILEVPQTPDYFSRGPSGGSGGAAEYVGFHPTMVAFCAVLTLLCLTSVFKTDAQYENHNFRHFPAEDLIPLTAAYGLALDHYAAERWTESIKYLELSLHLYRLLRDSIRYCALRCDGSNQKGNHAGNQELRVYWHVVTIASCQKKCREYFPALQLPPPGREILQDFSKRSPYRYLHHAHSKVRHIIRI